MPGRASRLNGGTHPHFQNTLRGDHCMAEIFETPMSLMGYRVGRASPHSEEERRAILNEIFGSINLPFDDDASPTYRSTWGAPKSAQRLYRMAIHIKFLVDSRVGNDHRNPVARADWLNDLAWLKKTYFDTNAHAFKWPDTRVA